MVTSPPGLGDVEGELAWLTEVEDGGGWDQAVDMDKTMVVMMQKPMAVRKDIAYQPSSRTILIIRSSLHQNRKRSSQQCLT